MFVFRWIWTIFKQWRKIHKTFPGEYTNWEIFKSFFELRWGEIKYIVDIKISDVYNFVIVKAILNPDLIDKLINAIKSRMSFFMGEKVASTQTTTSTSIRTYEFIPYFSDYMDAILGTSDRLEEVMENEDDDMVLDKTVEQLNEMDNDEYDAWIEDWREEIDDALENATFDYVKGTIYTTFQPSSTKYRRSEQVKQFKFNDYRALDNSSSKGKYYQRIEVMYPVGSKRTYGNSIHNLNEQAFEEQQDEFMESIEKLQSQLSESSNSE